jgi:AP-3 complex subunit delta
MAEVLLAAAWICGEYAQHVNDVNTLLEAMLRIKLSVVPGALLSVFLQNMLKLYALQLCKLEAEEDWDVVETLDNLFCSKLPEFQYTDHLEAQERVSKFF